MPHLSTQELRDAAVAHAERAHALLADAEAAWAAAGQGKVSDRETLRVELAEAHSSCSTALSSLILPTMVGPPAPASG